MTIPWTWIAVALALLLVAGLAIAMWLGETRCPTCGGLRFHAGWCAWRDL